MRVKSMLDIGLIIRDRRRSCGLGQRALAERVGVSRQWIIAVEKGKPRAEAGLVLRTLRALGLELSVSAEEEHSQPLEPGLLYIDIDAVVDRAKSRAR